MMREENQIEPLAPPGLHRRSDEELAGIKNKSSRKDKHSKCLVYILAGIVILGAIFLILGSILLRVNTPEFNLTSVTVRNLRHGNSSSPSPSFNMTLVTELTIDNRNYGYFDYHNSIGRVSYGNVTVGEIRISNGRIEARKTKRVNVTVEVRSNRVRNDRNLSSDISSGILELRSYGILRGRVNLFDIMKRSRSSELNCSMNILLSRRVVEDLVCNN